MAAPSKSAARAAKPETETPEMETPETETPESAAPEAVQPARKSRLKSASAAAGDEAASDAASAELRELLVGMLKDIYFAEKQILKALPKMTRAAKSEALKQAFEAHREETAGQIERLEQVFEHLGERAKGEPCEAIQGILQEGQDVMAELKGKVVIDVGLVGAAKAVEHYEIARYGSMAALARRLGLGDALALIEANLAEEARTDELLDGLGETAMAKAA